MCPSLVQTQSGPALGQQLGDEWGRTGSTLKEPRAWWVDEVRGSQRRVMRRLRVGWGKGPGLTPELKGQRVDQETGAGRNTQEGLAAGLCTAMKGRAETGTVRRTDRTSSRGSQYDVQTKEPAKLL